MNDYRRILITGSTGVLGWGFRSVQPEYPGCEFLYTSSRDCDLRNFAETVEWVRRIHPDAILHLAAVSGGVQLSRKYPATLLRDNVLMNIHLLEAARLQKIKKVVMTLTSGMYPPEAPLPLQEQSIHQGPPDESNYSSSYAKRLIEPAVRAYRQEFGLRAIGLVPNGIFGPGDKFRSEGATFIAALIQRFWDHRNDQTPLVVWGDGSPRREVTFSEDLARAFLWCLFHYDDEEILNVGTTEEHSVREIALMIAEELGLDRDRVVCDASGPKAVFQKSTDNSKFLRLSNFQYTPFQVGLRKTIQWLAKQEETELAKSPR
ncbi:MAG: NAD-dependent epimerase/dehydratase family protein [Candidatus Omnitrophica bacterium]|nr:NAD-dependent epimerase/dehydratase family protein [Candidatus Omnitrophota bacterium]